ncbi:MAG: hydroxyacylglutathione hydrolase [endosymbiont of Galathealinum brachiosum]|uniref:Hydroxyacylglutathione hydrolase n=1 Tax=endosymbiont of Galathealinum brachiosum TaxID=2200906 RepID=A0A370DHZ0_9GAMM|nr:MAG: hydroxyacylglutathione hydrolase [endosymbiont of Galathealinum brachiosum]
MLNITLIHALSDNYIWVLQRDNAPMVVIVDPGEADPVIEYIEDNNLQLVTILITHQHYDHTGGVADLLKRYPETRLIGPDRTPSDIPLAIDLPVTDLFTTTVKEDSEVKIPELDICFKVKQIPGHTLDHLAYIGEGVVFCGDTLFAAGCGRIFSGTPKMFADSLAVLMGLPEETKMYCAHEYTVDNLGFAKWVEPESDVINQRDDVEMAKQEEGIATVPTTVGLELKTNPFVRLQQPIVKQAAEKFAGRELLEDWEVFAALREWKDTKYD